VAHLNKSIALFKNLFHQGFLKGVATINLREFFIHDLHNHYILIIADEFFYLFKENSYVE